MISTEALSVPEPYGIMMRKDDPAFKKVVDNAMTRSTRAARSTRSTTSGSLQPGAAESINLTCRCRAQFKNVIANPTDSGDPTAYK